DLERFARTARGDAGPQTAKDVQPADSQLTCDLLAGDAPAAKRRRRIRRLGDPHVKWEHRADRTLEPPRRHRDDAHWAAVEMNRLSDDARVSVERSLPKVVAEHHDRLSAARRVDVRIIKTPQRRADAEHVEVASGCDETANGARLVPDPKRERRLNLRGNVGEDAGRR